MNTIPEGNKPITIFYSYAHEDRSLRDRLVKHLSLLKRQGHISDWSDQNVPPGQERRKEINKNLLSADIILLLVSANFLATNYCETSEVEMAMRRHAAGEAWVIPILVRPVDWETSSIGKLQALPYSLRPVANWSNRDSAFEEISKNIRSLVMDLQYTKNKADEEDIREKKVLLSEQSMPRPKKKKKRDLYKTILKAEEYSIGVKIQHKVMILRRNFSFKAIKKRSNGLFVLLLFLFGVLDLMVLPIIVLQWTSNSFITIGTFVLSALLFLMGITNKNNIIAAIVTFMYCVAWTIIGYVYMISVYHTHLKIISAVIISFLLSCLQLLLFYSRSPRRRRPFYLPKKSWVYFR